MYFFYNDKIIKTFSKQTSNEALTAEAVEIEIIKYLLTVDGKVLRTKLRFSLNCNITRLTFVDF